MDQEQIGKFIKELRLKNKLTQKEFADSLGVTFQAVSKWENGKNIPDVGILKEISKKYNVDIDEIISGTNKPKKNKKLILIVLGLIIAVAVISTIILIKKTNQKSDFEFKKITTTCSNFKITGTVAYSEKNSSMYISNIEFCGEEDSNVYEKITCNLYEDKKDDITKVNSCKKGTNTTLEDYLKDLTINVDKYEHSCNNFANKKFYIEIEAVKENQEIVTYKVPLNFKNTCDK